MIVEVTMKRMSDPSGMQSRYDDYDLCLIQALAEGLEMNWRFLNGEWIKVSMKKETPVRSVTLNLGDGNIVHMSNPTQFTVTIDSSGISGTSGSPSGTWTIQ